MKLRLAIVACLVLAVFGLILLAVSRSRPSPGVAYHNGVLQQCLSEEVEILIKCKDPSTREAFSKTVSVTEKDRTVWLLDHLRINRPPAKEGMFHHCRGHLVIEIKTPEHTHTTQYDHGEGIYPISDGTHRVGFALLEQAACSELNEYFRSLGFTDEDLGI